MFKIQMLQTKSLEFGNLKLGFVWDLDIGIWDLTHEEMPKG